MLKIKAEIMFYMPTNSDLAVNQGFSTKSPLRPAFCFGDGLLFSGTIKSDNNNEKYFYQNLYIVDVDFPTIEQEAYEVIQPLLSIGMSLNIQNAAKKIGEARIIDFIYKE